MLKLYISPHIVCGLPDRPNRRPCEKGGSPVLPYRKEVHTFAAACEHLIALCAKTGLTDDEDRLSAYYIGELNRLARSSQTTHNERRKPSVPSAGSGALEPLP